MLAEGHSSGPVFCDQEGGWLRKGNVLQRSFRQITDRADQSAGEKVKGVKLGKLPQIRFHDLRHTCATLLLLADENVKVVSERLGHASIQLTLDTYSHVLPTMQKRAAEKMDSIVGRRAVQ